MQTLLITLVLVWGYEGLNSEDLKGVSERAQERNLFRNWMESSQESKQAQSRWWTLETLTLKLDLDVAQI